MNEDRGEDCNSKEEGQTRWELEGSWSEGFLSSQKIPTVDKRIKQVKHCRPGSVREEQQQIGRRTGPWNHRRMANSALSFAELKTKASPTIFIQLE
jgi:hypothetical protein